MGTENFRYALQAVLHLLDVLHLIIELSFITGLLSVSSIVINVSSISILLMLLTMDSFSLLSFLFVKANAGLG